MLKLVNVVVDVAGDGPDELEAVEEGLRGIGDGLEVALGNDLELALEGLQEFDKVFGLGLLLHEFLVLAIVLLQNYGVLVVLVAEKLEDFLDLGHLELLEEGVEGCGAARPVLGLALRGQVTALGSLLLLFLDGF